MRCTPEGILRASIIIFHFSFLFFGGRWVDRSVGSGGGKAREGGWNILLLLLFQGKTGRI